MKIEKVNENQIRCTLTREDLVSRELKISELAYGTEKAKNLFRDMMRQANFEFGFEAEDIPLMIEAIPLNSECIVLIITKVEDPEELDTRFSRFAPSVTDDATDEETEETDEDMEDTEVMDLFHQMQSRQEETAEAPARDTVTSPAVDESSRSRLFVISPLRQVMNVCQVISVGYNGLSTLYKEEGSGKYLLLLTQGSDTRESFDRACNIVSEYGVTQKIASGSSTFLAEHYEALIQDNAVQALGSN